jgi:excisionase family DNA binding protein
MSIEADLAETKAGVNRVLAELAELRAVVEKLHTPAAQEPALLSVRQYAERAGLSACTVRRRVTDGTLSHVRVGGAIRIPSASLRPTDPADVARLAREARS